MHIEHYSYLSESNSLGTIIVLSLLESDHTIEYHVKREG